MTDSRYPFGWAREQVIKVCGESCSPELASVVRAKYSADFILNDLSVATALADAFLNNQSSVHDNAIKNEFLRMTHA
jgi:hypothetical protein